MCAPILLIFFNRPDCLEQTFNEIRKAKPEKLYLFQDGARADKPSDDENINKCRQIVQNIDWECEVQEMFCEVNNGCGKGPFKAINWLFENETEGIVLEDDCIASQSFFKFCTEMLEKYRNDDRIFLITGCNMELYTQVDSSYFFGYSGTNWGWASWRRNWDKMDYECSWIENTNIHNQLKTFLVKNDGKKGKCELESFKRANRLIKGGTNVSYWDVQWQAIRYLNHQLSIIPSKNLITNIGLGPTSTHAVGVSIPNEYHSKAGVVNFCYNERYDLDFPLNHPKAVIPNIEYDSKIGKALYPNLFVKIISKGKRVLKRMLNKQA